MRFHWRVDLSRIALDMRRVNKGLLQFCGLCECGAQALICAEYQHRDGCRVPLHRAVNAACGE